MGNKKITLGRLRREKEYATYFEQGYTFYTNASESYAYSIGN